MEAYISKLQSDHNQLNLLEKEKTQAIDELLNNDLTLKIVEYKNTIIDLREALLAKDKEKQILM